MEGIDGARARITELQGRLSTLGPPAAPPGRFEALLQRQQPQPRPADVAVGSPSAVWLGAQRPAALGGLAAGTGGPSLVAGPAAAVPPGTPNGRIPLAALASIGGDDRLAAPAAAGFLALRDAAARDGIELPVNDSYRSLAEQEDMARRKGLYSEGGLAAAPGTSTHGLGLSVDLQLDDDALTWMRANGRRFGFVEDVPREPWHWTYRP